jgi:branched-chain amino acid transport system permease protein
MSGNASRSPAPKSTKRKAHSPFVVIALVSCMLGILPLLVSSALMLNFLSFALILTLAAQGWNILGGYGGQFSFGHAVFFGAGAYVMALGQVKFFLNPWLVFLLSLCAGAIVGILIGVLSFRAGLRGSYFALVTLAFAEVFRIAANASDMTGGAAGLLVPLQVELANMQFADKRLFYWFALACVTGALVLTQVVAQSRLGVQIVAVRENEDAARALGVDALAVKLKAIVLSGAMTAAAGALYVQKFLYLDANLAFGTWISVETLLAPIIGGLGTVFGPLVGTFVLVGLGEGAKSIIRQWFGGAVPGIDLILFGVLLIASVSYTPNGVLGLARSLIVRVRGGKS